MLKKLVAFCKHFISKVSVMSRSLHVQVSGLRTWMSCMISVSKILTETLALVIS